MNILLIFAYHRGNIQMVRENQRDEEAFIEGFYN